AFLRTGLLAADFPATASLPLDTGTPTATVPPHLRRLVILRDRHCAFPGCRQKPVHCQAHHLIPRSQGGVTALHNLVLLCPFHHLVVIHRWGWTLALNGDGTTTATSPDRRKTLHSHGPPQATAA
ncbi:MAG TPA: HNH endonuclease signature motif containing protein, partial [Streptosporangiaceae bacterium]|nr:HNH endonuclease signature motif containing protein [Streptosporangiaceae bacterium]